MIVEWVLRLLGYNEKSQYAHEAIRNACLLNADAGKRLDRVRATLNGENGWFKEEDGDGPTSE
jgi:hypothetical protein